MTLHCCNNYHVLILCSSLTARKSATAAYFLSFSPSLFFLLSPAPDSRQLSEMRKSRRAQLSQPLLFTAWNLPSGRSQEIFGSPLGCQGEGREAAGLLLYFFYPKI